MISIQTLYTLYNFIHNSSIELLHRGHIQSIWFSLTTWELGNKTMNSGAHHSTGGSLSWLVASGGKSPNPTESWLPPHLWLLRQRILALPRPGQRDSWWGWPLVSWCSSSLAARWWICSILEADMPVKGHYKAGPHKNTGLVGSNKRWGDSEMVLS